MAKIGRVDPGSKLHCLKCEYDWKSREGKRPLRCPKCKSVDWESPAPDPLGVTLKKMETEFRIMELQHLITTLEQRIVELRKELTADLLKDWGSEKEKR